MLVKSERFSARSFSRFDLLGRSYSVDQSCTQIIHNPESIVSPRPTLSCGALTVSHSGSKGIRLSRLSESHRTNASDLVWMGLFCAKIWKGSFVYFIARWKGLDTDQIDSREPRDSYAMGDIVPYS